MPVTISSLRESISDLMNQCSRSVRAMRMAGEPGHSRGYPGERVWRDGVPAGSAAAWMSF